MDKFVFFEGDNIQLNYFYKFKKNLADLQKGRHLFHLVPLSLY